VTGAGFPLFEPGPSLRELAPLPLDFAWCHRAFQRIRQRSGSDPAAMEKMTGSYIRLL